MTSKHYASPKIATAKVSSFRSPSIRSPLKDIPITPILKEKTIRVAELLDSKLSTAHDRSYKTESPHVQSQINLRDSSCHIGGESLFYGNLGVEPLSSELNLTHMLSDEGKTDGYASNTAESYRRLVEELLSLRRELEQKNSLIDKLVKENGNLRHEMEEFLSTVDEAREYIDVELKECNNRIKDLEAEIEEVRAENRIYKEKLRESFSASHLAKEKKITAQIEEEFQDYYTTAKKDMEDFYFKLNEQMAEFMGSSKNKHQQFQKHVQAKVFDSQENRQPLTVQTLNTQPAAFEPILKSTTPSKPNAIRDRPPVMSSKIVQATEPDLKRRTPKSSLNTSINRALETHSPSNLFVGRKKTSSVSISYMDADQENSLGVSPTRFEERRKSAKDLSSPKSSLLRAKLRSDAILQEMKKRLSDGGVNP